MSKLFKALESLERQAQHNEIEMPREYFPRRQEKVRRPFLKVLVLFGLTLLTGGVLLGVAWQMTDGTLNLQAIFPGETQQIVAADPAKEPVVAVPEQTPPAIESVAAVLQQPEVTEPVTMLPPATIIRESDVASPGIEQLEMEMRGAYREVIHETVAAVLQQQAQPETVPPDASVPRNVIKKPAVTSEGAIVFQPDMDVDKQQMLAAKQAKKYIYQAEKARVSGDVDSALRYFSSAWELVKRPGIANNLAALLMQQKKYREAITILEEGLSLAPDDPDLLFNRKIAGESL
jgi:tetratricopeptide (TPR) repeat protein